MTDIDRSGLLSSPPPGDADVLDAYRAVAVLYAEVPPLCLWRAWEYAVYRGIRLNEPVLDLGCGDGRFFRLAWPGVRQAVGVDSSAAVADAAARSGVYQQVRVAPAASLPFPDGQFGSIVANCALEHMDDLPRVLAEARRCLRPGGSLVASVITDEWDEWNVLPDLALALGAPGAPGSVRGAYQAYHHHVNVLSPAGWHRALAVAGFEVARSVPIVPELVARTFLVIDAAWHLPGPSPAQAELGGSLQRYLGRLPGLVDGSLRVLEGLLTLDPDRSTGAGLVITARRPEVTEAAVASMQAED